MLYVIESDQVEKGTLYFLSCETETRRLTTALGHELGPAVSEVYDTEANFQNHHKKILILDIRKSLYVKRVAKPQVRSLRTQEYERCM